MTTKKYIEAIIRIPIEIQPPDGKLEIHMNYASVDFEPLLLLPTKKTEKNLIREKLGNIQKLLLSELSNTKPTVINNELQKSQELEKEEEENDSSSSDEEEENDSSSIEEEEENDSSSIEEEEENDSSSIEEEEENDSSEDHEECILYDNTTKKEGEPSKKEENINDIMDIFSIFIQPEELNKKKKPKNTSFKKKRRNKSNKRYTAKQYEDII
jgi:hypothetical protein